jgi:Fe-S cluster assembly scaffold protein SufB
MPWWGPISPIDFANIFYSSVRPKMAASWEDLPDDIKGFWDKLGIEAEKIPRWRDSTVEVVYKIKKELDDIGALPT